MFRWFFFCDTAISQDKNSLGKSRDDPCDRKRLMCWAVLCTFVWAHITHSLLNCILLVAVSVCLSLLVNLVTRGHHNRNEIKGGAFHLALVVGLISAITTLTCQPVFLRYEYLIKKMALKEYDLWKYWCSNTYITLVSVTVISCFIRGIHKRLG